MAAVEECSGAVPIPDLFQSPVDAEAVRFRQGEFAGFSRRDKYGFELAEEFVEEELRVAQRNAEQEALRQKAWAVYLEKRAASGKSILTGSKLRSLVRRGIPAEHRKRVWLHLLVSDAFPLGARAGPGEAAGEGDVPLSSSPPSGSASPPSARATHSSTASTSAATGTGERDASPSGIAAALAGIIKKPSSLSRLDRALPKTVGGKRYQEWLAGAGSDADALAQIKADVRRTFPAHAEYDSEDGLQRLSNVLLAFAHSRPDIGYCQSMNFICAQLLLIMDEEETFLAFSKIVQHIVPHTYFTASMIGSHIDQRVFEVLIRERLPAIHRKFSEYALTIGSVTAQWFLCMFVCVTPAETTFRIWDAVLLEGMQVLFQVALALLKNSEQELVAAEDEGVAFAVLRDLPKRAFDAERILKIAFSNFAKVTSGKVTRLRAALAQPVEEEQREVARRRERAAEVRRKRKEQARGAEEAEAAAHKEHANAQLGHLLPEGGSRLSRMSVVARAPVSLSDKEKVWHRRVTTSYHEQEIFDDQPSPPPALKIGSRT